MSRLGAHIVGGPRSGFGLFAASGPALVVSTEQGGAIDEVEEVSPNTVTVFRQTRLYLDAPQGIDQATPAQARIMAETLFPQLRAIWSTVPRANYYTVLNEPAGNDFGVLPSYLAFELRMMELAEAVGLRLCVLNLATGTPAHFTDWASRYVPHIRRAFEGGHIYGRHAYGGPLVPLSDGDNGTTERPLNEAAYLRAMGLTGGVAITELGINGGFGYVGDAEYTAQAIAYDSHMKAHPNIIGGALWTLGDWHGANWQGAIPALSQYIAADVEDPGPGPGPGPTPTDCFLFPAFTRTVLLTPRALADEETTIVANWLRNGIPVALWSPGAKDLRPVGYAGWTHQDAIESIYQSAVTQGKTDSLLLVAEGERIGSGLSREWLRANFPQVEPFAKFIRIKSPTVPLSLTVPIRGPYTIVPGGLFDAPRDYGNGKHEGLDFTATADDLPALASAPGVVDKIGYSATGYGHYIRARHETGSDVFVLWYAHLKANSILVKVGDRLAPGQKIATSGSSGNSSGVHVHLTVQHLGKGLPGYIVADVIDPHPLMVWGEPPTPPGEPAKYTGPPIVGTFVRGLDQPASDWYWKTAKVVFDETSLIPKFHTNGDNPNWYDRYKGSGFNLVRILLDPTFAGGGGAIYDEVRGEVARFYDRGARNFVVLNEPNIEGVGYRWTTPEEFGVVFRELTSLLAANFSGIRLWYPGLSPGGTDATPPGSKPYHDFLRRSRERGALDFCYGIVQHTYTGIVGDAGAAADRLLAETLDFRSRYALTRPLVIGEFSVNRPAAAAYKRDVYTRFYAALATYKGIQAAYSFTSSWYPAADHNGEGWLENGIRV